MAARIAKNPAGGGTKPSRVPSAVNGSDSGVDVAKEEADLILLERDLGVLHETRRAGVESGEDGVEGFPPEGVFRTTVALRSQSRCSATARMMSVAVTIPTSSPPSSTTAR